MAVDRYKKPAWAQFCYSIAGLVVLFLVLSTRPALSHDTRLLQLYGLGEDPTDANICMYRAYAYIKNSEFERAVEEYSNAIDFEPDFTMAYINRGRTYMDLGQLDKAMNDMNYASGLELDNYEVYINRGLIYAMMNQFDSAVADCNRALKLDSVAIEAYANRGNYYAHLGKMELGLADCEQALVLDSTYTPAWLGCTLINLELGRKEETVKAFKVLLKYNPPHLSSVIEQLKSVIDTTTVK